MHRAPLRCTRCNNGMKPASAARRQQVGYRRKDIILDCKYMATRLKRGGTWGGHGDSPHVPFGAAASSGATNSPVAHSLCTRKRTCQKLDVTPLLDA